MTTSSRWWHSLADHPQAMRSVAVHRDGFDESCAHSLVVAPCCGRHRRADSIVALHGLKTVIKGGNHLPARDHNWACTDCLDLLVRDPSNGWTWSKLYRALGADAGTIRHHRARELQVEEEKADHAAGRGHNPQESFEKHHAALASGVRELPGTEPPK